MAMIPENPEDRGGIDEEDLVPGDSGRIAGGDGGASNGPLICAFKGLGDAFAGALMGSVFGFGSGLFKRQGFKVALREGGSSAKTFALLSGVHGIVACYLKRIRGVEDALNAGIAGCATGLALSTPGTPQALLQSCVSFGVFSYILENINKTRPAMAAPLKQPSGMNIQERNRLHFIQSLVPVLPPFSLPPPMLGGPFSLFWNGNLQKIVQRQQSRPT
ncbi:unnamed protein product [Calypogeia fissa]